MNRKWLSLTLAALSAAICAMPAAASAWSMDPAGASFTGTTTGTSQISLLGEPILTCGGPDHITSSYTPNSTTTGTITVDATNCHFVILGITIACTTAGSGNTVVLSGTFHNVTSGTQTATQIVWNSLTFKCGSTTPIVVTGTATGVITSPACNTSSSTATLEFANASGLTGETEGSGNKVAGTFNAEATLTSTGGNITKTC